MPAQRRRSDRRSASCSLVARALSLAVAVRRRAAARSRCGGVAAIARADPVGADRAGRTSSCGDSTAREPVVAYLRGRRATTTPTTTAKAIEHVAPIVSRLADRDRSSAAKRSRCSASRSTWPGGFAEARAASSRPRARGRATTSNSHYVLGTGLPADRQTDAARGALAVTFGVPPDSAAAHSSPRRC